MLAASLDYLSGRMNGSLPFIAEGGENRAAVLQLCSEFWGEPAEGGRTFAPYTRRLEFHPSAHIFEVAGEEEAGPMYVQLKGAALSLLDAQQIAHLTRTLQGCKFDPGRVDARADDYSWHNTPQAIYADHCKNADERTWAGYHKHSVEFIENQDAEFPGATLYLGPRKGGDDCLRIYDKNAQSRGQVNAVRWEVQYRGVKARRFWSGLEGFAGTEALMKMLAGEAVCRCSFFKRWTATKHLSRKEHADWYTRLRGELTRVECQTMAEESVDWSEEMTAGELRVGAFLAAVKEMMDATGAPPHAFAEWAGILANRSAHRIRPDLKRLIEAERVKRSDSQTWHQPNIVYPGQEFPEGPADKAE